VVARAVPAKLTCEPALKPLPNTVRVMGPLPAVAEAGVRLVITGTGLGTISVKAVALVAVPPGVVTVIRPELAPAGTTNDKAVSLATVKSRIDTPFSVSAVAPLKLVPTTVTVIPTAPLAGVKLVIVGAGTVTVRTSSAVVPPPGAGLLTATP
jgi:hypothetical protein